MHQKIPINQKKLDKLTLAKQFISMAEIVSRKGRFLLCSWTRVWQSNVKTIASYTWCPDGHTRQHDLLTNCPFQGTKETIA